MTVPGFHGASDPMAFALAFGASPMPMLVTDAHAASHKILWANDAFLTLTGYPRAELVGRNCRLLQGTGTDSQVVARLGQALRDAEPISCELLNYRRDGSPFWNGMTITPVHDSDGRLTYFFAALADITEKRSLEEAMRGTNDELERQVGERTAALQAALEQKTALLHEVDHRVKNNLQVISSLMLLKARRTPEGEAREALSSMAERIGALSTAHRMLYSAGDVTRFNLTDFTDDFLSDLNAGLDPERTRVEAKIDAIAVSAAMAAPLALMIHELATNAVRHAFPAGRPGRIVITARRGEAGMDLSIADDGVGLDAGPVNPAGFGRNLVEMVVRQLRGTIAWRDGAPGTCVEIHVPLGSEA